MPRIQQTSRPQTFNPRRSPFAVAVRLALGLGLFSFLLFGTLIAVGIVIVPTQGASAQADKSESGGPVAIVPAGETRQFVAALAGEAVVVDGTVHDLFAAGRTIDIGGTVLDNAFVAGQVATIPGTIGGDLFVAGSTRHDQRPGRGRRLCFRQGDPHRARS